MGRIYTFLILLAAFGSVYLAGCSNIKDLQPPDQEQLPDSIVSVFTTAFPNAQDAVFKPLEVNKDKFYEVNFRLASDNYYSVLNSRRIISASKLLAEAPDSLKNILATYPPDGGVLSDIQQPVFEPADTVLTAKYRLNDKDYLASFRSEPTMGKIRLDMTRYSKFHYLLYSQDNNKLPTNISRFLTENSLAFYMARVYVQDNNKPNYEIHASDSNQLYFFIFDEDGTLEYSSYTPDTKYNSLTEMPAEIQNYVNSSPEFSSYRFYYAAKYVFDGKVSYSLELMGTSTAPEFYPIYYRTIFDQNANFKWTSYLGYD